MTEKRFRYDGLDIEDNVEMVKYAICTSEGGLKVTNLLNELSDENGQLKKEIDFMSKGRLSSNELLQLVYSELLHEGSITFKRYTEIRNFCYEEFKKEVSE